MKQTTQVMVILGCVAHLDRIIQVLDEATIGDWVILPGEQARRLGHLEYSPPNRPRRPEVVLGFGSSQEVGTALEQLAQAARSLPVECTSCGCGATPKTEQLR